MKNINLKFDDSPATNYHNRLSKLRYWYVCDCNSKISEHIRINLNFKKTSIPECRAINLYIFFFSEGRGGGRGGVPFCYRNFIVDQIWLSSCLSRMFDNRRLLAPVNCTIVPYNMLSNTKNSHQVTASPIIHSWLCTAKQCWSANQTTWHKVPTSPTKFVLTDFIFVSHLCLLHLKKNTFSI